MKLCATLVLAAAFAVALVTAGCHSIPPPTPLDQLDAQQSSGYRVYQQYCANCHHDRDSSPLHGPSLMSLYKKPYLPSGAPANDDRIMAAIVHGHGMMPAMNGQMTDQQLQDLFAYMHTL